MPRIFAILVLLLVLVAPRMGRATTLEAAIATAFSTDDAGLRLLRDNGARLGSLLTLERVPSGQYVLEVEVELGTHAVRYPLKFSRADQDWKLEWQPEGVYAAALLGIARSGALVEAPGAPQWTQVARMPAMPIVATRKRFVTPFGEVALDDHGDEPPQGDLVLSPGLLRAMNAWIKRVLDDDAGPAGFDLLLDGGLDWRTTNKLLFNAANMGLYEVTIVTREMGVVQVASPARQARFVVALYPLDAGFGVRVAADGEVVAGNCAPEMTACVIDAAGLDSVLAATPPGAGPWMFAATADVTAAQVLPFLRRLSAIAGAAPHRLLIGYVQK